MQTSSFPYVIANGRRHYAIETVFLFRVSVQIRGRTDGLDNRDLDGLNFALSCLPGQREPDVVGLQAWRRIRENTHIIAGSRH